MYRPLLAILVVATTSSCVTEFPAGNPTRETLPNGAVLVRYPDLPALDVSDINVVSPSGGFWSANTGSYRLTRTGEGGDTPTVIEASLPRIPVTSEDEFAVQYVVRAPLP